MDNIILFSHKGHDFLNTHDFYNYISELMDTDPQGALELTYIFLVDNQDQILEEDRDIPIEDKIKSLDRLIKCFEKSEHYERCSKLVKLKNRILNDYS